MRLKVRGWDLARAAVLVAAAATASAQETADTKEREAGPKNVVITYRATPANRVAFRKYMLGKGMQNFAKWKSDGIVDSYRLFFNRYVDPETWDLLALLTFKEYAQVTRWREVEADYPAGLAPEGLALATPVGTLSLDLIWHGASPTPAAPGKAVFFVIPYDYYPNTIDAYTKYVDEYVVPQVKGWVAEDVLANYGIYLNRYPTSRPWKSLFILEYRDAAAFGAREATIAKVRAALRADPKWKALSDVKLNMRVEKETAVADELPSAR